MRRRVKKFGREKDSIPYKQKFGLRNLPPGGPITRNISNMRMVKKAVKQLEEDIPSPPYDFHKDFPSPDKPKKKFREIISGIRDILMPSPDTKKIPEYTVINVPEHLSRLSEEGMPLDKAIPLDISGRFPKKWFESESNRKLITLEIMRRWQGNYGEIKLPAKNLENMDHIDVFYEGFLDKKFLKYLKDQKIKYGENLYTIHQMTIEELLSHLKRFTLMHEKPSRLTKQTFYPELTGMRQKAKGIDSSFEN